MRITESLRDVEFVNPEFTKRRESKPFIGYVSLDDFDGECDDEEVERSTKLKL